MKVAQNSTPEKSATQHNTIQFTNSNQILFDRYVLISMFEGSENTIGNKGLENDNAKG